MEETVEQTQAKPEPVKISALELENVKRIRAVALRPTENGLTVIGGRNGQGKTSVVDAISWALGGKRKQPSKPNREGSATPAKLHVELSNGLVVERSGKNASLTVTDPSGKKAGQKLLDSFIEELAIDLPKFMVMTDNEKAQELLRIIGIGGELDELDKKLGALKAERLDIGQRKRAKDKIAEEMPFFPDAPDHRVSPAELIEQQQAILAKNGENQRKREKVGIIKQQRDNLNMLCDSLNSQIMSLNEELKRKTEELMKLTEDYQTALRDAADLEDEKTDEIEQSIANIDALNQKVEANERRKQALKDAESLNDDYQSCNSEVNAVENQRKKLLETAKMPLDGLTVEDGKLVYNGAVWSDMSGAEQLRVATAVVRSLKPECGFVLVDKLEQMDSQTLAEFGAWAESEGLQVIGTRVATDDTCSVIIEDGRVAEGAGQLKAEMPEIKVEIPEVKIPEVKIPAAMKFGGSF